MKKILIIAGCWLTSVYAQSDTLKLSLEDAIQYGLKTRWDLQSGQEQVSIVKNEWNKSKYQWLPTLNGVANIRYNTELPTTVLPAGALGNPTDITAQFGTRNNTTLAIDFEQPIIKPTIFSDTKVGHLQYDQQRIRYEQKEKDVRKFISLAYYDVLIKKRQMEIAEVSLSQSKELFKIAESRFNLGSIKENDYLKQQLEFQNSDLKQKRAVQDYELSLEQLKKEMNFTERVSIVLTENIQSTTQVSTKVDTSFAFHSDIKILDLQYSMYKVSRKRGFLNSLPSLSFYANYTLQFQRNDFDYSQGWFPFNFIGIRLNVPIFNQWRNQASIKEFKLKMNQGIFDINYRKQTLLYEYNKYSTDLENALANLKYAEKNYELAKLIYEKDIKQYDLGFIGYNELVLSLRTQNDAEQNLMQSWYAYHSARLNYENIIQ